MTKIGVDIDEVLAETVNGFLAFYNTTHGTDYQFDTITDYSFGKQFGLSPEEELASIKEFFASDYFPALKPVNGSVRAIKEIAKYHELFAVSSRPEQLLPQTKMWLEQHFGDSFTRIILTNSLLDTSRTKSKICQALGLDIFIEDQISYAEDCAQVCSAVYLLDKPWNQAEITNKKIMRVKSWKDIAKSVNAYSGHEY